jgi:hypothetical protein
MPAAALAIPVAGAVLGGIGASKQASASKKQAGAINGAATPYGTSGMFGSSFVGPNHTIQTQLSPDAQGQYNQLGGIFNQYTGGGSPTAGFQQFSQGMGNNQLPQLFGNALNQAQMTPDQAFQLQQGQMQGMYNTYGQQGIQNLGQQQSLFGQAQNIAGQSTQGLSDNYLSLLRQQAAPQDQRNMDMLANSAFNSGQLGGPGGRQALQDFGTSLGQADIGRQMAAQNLGLQQQQQNTSVAGLFGNMGSQMGSQGMQFANMLPQLSQNSYNTASQYSDLGNTRAQQMLQNASGLFGFGNQLNQQDFTQGMSALQGQMGMNTALQNQAQMGGNMAANQAGAMAGAPAQGSPMGSFLGGIGTGMMAGGFPSFGGGQIQPVSAPGGYVPGPMPSWNPNATMQPMPSAPYFGGYNGPMAPQPAWQPYRP